MRKLSLIGSIMLIAVTVLGLVGVNAALAGGNTFPNIIPLPDGFRPEGIAVGHGTTFFVGSIPQGAIYSGDLRTGEGSVLVPPQTGRVAIGLSFDDRTGYLFVAGGPTGNGFVYDTSTGGNVAHFEFSSGRPTFVNDVVVTRDAAYFTDSFQPVLYKVPLSKGGILPGQDAVEEIPLGGDFTFVPGAFNTNGIDATSNGNTLVIVNSGLGILYSVDPATGMSTEIDLSGDSVPNGDGILLDGKTLYVVQNRLNQIAVINMAPDLLSGAITETITAPDFRVPTTIAEFGSDLYAVNARFGISDPDNAEYEVVKVSKR